MLYQGFTFLECATAGCSNGRAAAAVPAGPTARQLAQFAMGLAVGQQWMEVSTGKLFELTALGSNAVDLDACFLSGTGQWIKHTVSIIDLADPTKWRHLASAGPTTWTASPFLSVPRSRPRRP